MTGTRFSCRSLPYCYEISASNILPRKRYNVVGKVVGLPDIDDQGPSQSKI